MQLQAIPLTVELVPFVDRVYEQNRAVLHGNIIPIEEWRSVFGDGIIRPGYIFQKDIVES